MKKLILLMCVVMCLGAGEVRGQGYLFNFKVNTVRTSDIYTTNIKIYYNTVNNSTPKKIFEYNRKIFEDYENSINPISFIINNYEGPVKEIWTEGKIGRLNPPAINCDYKKFIYQRNNQEHCFNQTVYTKLCNDVFGDINCSFTQEVLSIFISQSDPSNIFPLEDSITFSATPGFNPDFYKWEYSFAPFTSFPSFPLFSSFSSWKPFPPNLNNKSTVKTSAKGLLGGSIANDSINKSIRVRLNTCNRPPPLILSIRISAPHISSVITKDPLCFDGSGSATVKFNRFAKPGEKIFVIFNKIDSLNNMIESGPTDSIMTLNKDSVIVSNLTPGKYIVKLLGTFQPTNGNLAAPTYTGSPINHERIFTITKPARVVFSDTTTHVWCYNGSDGKIGISASGGSGAFAYQLYKNTIPANADSAWMPFGNAGIHAVSDLSAGIYKLKVRDSRGCVAKTGDGTTGIDSIRTINISQPTNSIQVDLVSTINPKAYGFSNGRIVVKVSGGTIKANSSYGYVWRDANNNIINPANTDSSGYSNGYFRIVLKNVGAGSYTLTIQDKHYNLATTKIGCQTILTYLLTEPPPLRVSFQIRKLPSCNNANPAAGPVGDGILVANASGGVRLSIADNNALPYYYSWKKKNAQNTWDSLFVSDSIATNLESGWYSVNVKDKNNIILGIYTANVLVSARDSAILLPQPPLLTINPIVTPVNCSGALNGAIVSAVAGGTPPYSYSWGTTTSLDLASVGSANLTGLGAGNYTLVATDANGCKAIKPITVPEPLGYLLRVDTIVPTCRNGCDGRIRLRLTGGTLPYLYRWQHNPALNSDSLSGLCAGLYKVTISDAQNCSFERQIWLTNPAILKPMIAKRITLCNGQLARISMKNKAAGASYRWSSESGTILSNDSVAVLSAAGRYYAQINDSKGCVGTDTLTLLRVNVPIASDMLLPTSAYTSEEILLVNVSRPLPEIVEWLMPTGATVLERNYNFIRFSFADTGTYSISLRTGVGECREQISRNVIVISQSQMPGIGAASSPFIQDLKVLPIPNNGHFSLHLKLRETASATVRLIYLNSSALITKRTLSGHKEYLEQFDLAGIAPGMYMLVVETPKERRTIKVVVQ